jgi:hypothetical protein
MSAMVALVPVGKLVLLLNRYGAEASWTLEPALNNILKMAELFRFRSMAADPTKYVGPNTTLMSYKKLGTIDEEITEPGILLLKGRIERGVGI